VRRLGFGAGDFTTDIGVAWASDGAAYLVARSLMVMGSRAARREPPLDTVYPEVRDLEGLARDAQTARALGFGGKMCIHPSQVSVVNAAFTPGAAEIEEARRCVEAFDAATREGRASVAVDGKLVDYANAERYRRVLAAAQAAGAAD
jgi:citrate lyase subunit beta/citryl-CoA lyase